MIHGFDTGFLIAAEVSGHPNHLPARNHLDTLRKSGDRFAIAPQVIAEFAHVVCDPKRFSQPLTFEDALNRSEAWWDSPDVDPILPDDDAMKCFFDWMEQHQLGRKRILDTMLAATYFRAGIDSILTTNPGDFSIFGVFHCIVPT